eukprot:764808-Hanusia_phi.AAC.3
MNTMVNYNLSIQGALKTDKFAAVQTPSSEFQGSLIVSSCRQVFLVTATLGRNALFLDCLARNVRRRSLKFRSLCTGLDHSLEHEFNNSSRAHQSTVTIVSHSTLFDSMIGLQT